MVADCEGISADDDGGDRGKVVRVKGLGRSAAESMLGGVMPRGALCGLGERLEEEDHGRREGAGGLCGKLVHDVSLRQRVAVVARGGVDAALAGATVERRVSRPARLAEPMLPMPPSASGSSFGQCSVML